MQDERNYWLGFSAFPGVGPARFKLLLDYFGTAKAAWSASKNDLLHIKFGDVLTESFIRFRQEFSVEGYAHQVKDKGIAVLLWSDEKYPKLLKQIEDPPFVLYVKGKRKSLSIPSPLKGEGQGEGEIEGSTNHIRDSRFRGNDKETNENDKLSSWDISKSIGVVGTRKVTRYGREVTKQLTTDLVSAGFTIVSGLALGVDAVAHEAAIQAGGKTIAVLGCGVDCCYPTSNQFLYNKIIGGNGVVISEMPLSHQPGKGLFPARNRIISGLSLGVVVTEGAYDSGSLITASDAASQGREVFAVPGPITSTLSKGPAELIKKGAKLVTNVQDILEEFQMIVKRQVMPAGRQTGSVKKSFNELSKEEAVIVKFLEDENRHFDEMVRELQVDVSKLAGILSMMEIKGIVKNVGNNMYGLG